MTYNRIRALDILDHFHIDPIKIAEWIIDQRIKILGIFDDPGKSIPKEVTSSEVGESKLSQAIDMLRRELRLCLKARSDLIHRVDAGSGASFEMLDQLDEIENKIQSLIGFFIFDKDDFERLLLTADNDKKAQDRKNTDLYPNPDSVLSNTKKRFLNIIVPIKTGPSIKWSDVKITFIGEDEILVQHGSERDHRKYFHAGFEDRRNGKPIVVWAAFREAAAKDGLIPFNFDNRRFVEKTAQSLNKKLSQLFPDLQEMPTQLNKKKDGYYFAFQIESLI